ncbi:MAG: hypothetical protein JRI46_00160 [Deltaproteobacteria bacterium]|nr:hypothetical protein [Deltaproteobacteria bacterium]
MHSFDLRHRGFKHWVDFRLTNEAELGNTLPDKNGAYVIRDRCDFGRYLKTSDIVCIGHAPKQSLKNRISLYFKGYKNQRTNKKIHDWLLRFNTFQISWIEVDNAEKCEEIERELLNAYQEDHGELPPFNAQ